MVLTGVGAIAPMVARPAIAQESNLIQESRINVLTVTGEGREQVETTIAQVNLGVEVEAETAEAAQQEAARRSTAVVELLRDRNVDQLQTTGIRLNPQYQYSENRQTLTGYVATNTVSFEVPIEAAGEILDEAVAAGATRIQGVSFRASPGRFGGAQFD